MRTREPHHICREGDRSTYMSKRATPAARAAFAVWGLMSEIIGAAIVVFGALAAALVLTGTALVMFF